ncbi:DUF6339 family protein [Cryobacterium sp. AP23]
MEPASACALKYDALSAIGEALTRATTPEDFLAEVDVIVSDPGNLLKMPFETGQPDPLTTTKHDSQDDKNAPRVYGWLGAIDPSNASDPRLWTYAAFVSYRDYMLVRWPLIADKRWKNRVMSRWLISNASRPNLMRHGIARLWWITSLTYDAKCAHPLAAESQNPFAYTAYVLQNEDRVVALFERESGSVPKLARAVLEHLAADDTRATGQYIKNLMKEITLVYAFRDLEVLDDGQIRRLVLDLAEPRGPLSLVPH